MNVEKNVLKNCYWLKDKQKKIIEKAVDYYRIKGLSDSKIKKLCIILCCIPYAEKIIKIKGKFLTRLLKGVISIFPFLIFFSNTIGTWNLHICHAQKFNLSKSAFRKILKNDETGIYFVIFYIINYIDLDKPVDFIFAEYNIAENATYVAAFQKAINYLFYPYKYQIAIDGIFGENTKKAMLLSAEIFSINFHNCSHKNIKVLVQIIEKYTKKKFDPFIPFINKKRNLKYLFYMLINKKWKKILNVFRNHINVSLYVDSSLKSYNYLLEKSSDFNK